MHATLSSLRGDVIARSPVPKKKTRAECDKSISRFPSQLGPCRPILLQCVVMQTRIATNPRRANNKGLTRRMRRATPAQAMRTARSSSPRSTCAALPQAMASLATSGATGGMALESAGVAKKMRSGTSALETKTHIDNSAENNACLLDYTGCLGFRAANRSVFERRLTRALAGQLRPRSWEMHARGWIILTCWHRTPAAWRAWDAARPSALP